MITLLSVISLGFFLGMRHATDADHIIAVSTIIDKEPSVKKAAWVGVFWGIGHTLTILVFGGIVILFSIVIPPKVGMSLELGVALMLIFLGYLNLRGFKKWLHNTFSSAGRKEESKLHHAHHHRHGDYIHNHPHGHHPEQHGHDEEAVPTTKLDRWFGDFRFYQFIRPALIGVVHGFAGTAALTLMLIPMIQDVTLALIYLLVFGVGTIIGMMLITAAIAVPFIYSTKTSPVFNKQNLRMAAGFLSLGFGLFLFYQIGFVDGLFG
jgi:high-affinity nickel-transport protein